MILRTASRGCRGVVLAGALAGGLAAWSPVAAQAETLAEALAMAYMSNPTLLARRAQLRATDEGVPQALSGWRPRVTVSASVGRQDIESESTSGVRTDQKRNPLTGAVQATQSIYQGGRTTAQIRTAEENVQAQRALLVSTEQSVLLDAATSFVDTLRDEAVLELNVNNEQRLLRQHDATLNRFKVGELTRTDVAQSESRLAQAGAARHAAEGQLAITRAAYRRVIGQLPGRLSEPKPYRMPRSRNDVLNTAGQANPNVLAAIFTERAARSDVRSIQGELLPDVSVVGSYQRSQESSTGVKRQDVTGVTAQVTVPLYEAGSVTSRVRQARQTASQRLTQVEEARRSAIEQAARAFESLQTARARTEALLQQVRAAEIALDGVQQEQLVGTRTVLDVLDAEQELLNAQVELVRSRREEQVGSYQLLVAVGRFTAGDLGLPVQLYDYEAHYREVRGKWWGTTSSFD